MVEFTLRIAVLLFAMTLSGMSLAQPGSRGTLTGTDADGVEWIYQGDVSNGKPHGRGVITWRTGVRYEGDFANGARTGIGKQEWPGLGRYEGAFEAGNRTGLGIFTWPSGARFEGLFIDGKRTRNGRLTLPSAAAQRPLLVAFVNPDRVKTEPGKETPANQALSAIATENDIYLVLNEAVYASPRFEITDAVLDYVKSRRAMRTTAGPGGGRLRAAVVDVRRLIAEGGGEQALPALNEAIRRLAERFELDLVLQSVLYAHSGLDISEEVLQMHRAQSVNEARLRQLPVLEVSIRYVSVDRLLIESALAQAATRQLQKEFESRNPAEQKQEFTRRRNEELQKLITAGDRAVRTLAERGNFDYVLQEAVYVHPSLDVTREVILEMDAR